MKGHVYRRGCTCKKRKCTCGAKYTFVVDIGTDPKTGKRKQKSKGGFKTKQEAELALASLIHDIQAGTFIKESEELFKDFAKSWLVIYAETNLVKPGTIRVRQHEINNLLPYLANLKLKHINRETYQNALNDLKEKGYADNTLSGIHRTGRMIFRKAIEMEKIKRDPTEFAYIRKTKKSVEDLEANEIPKYLEKEELNLLLQTAKEKGLFLDHLMFLILSFTGIRVGELVALKWRDVDFNQHTIRITKTYYNPTNNTLKYQLVPPKTKKSKRTISIDEEVIVHLKRHLALQNKIKMKKRNMYHDEDFIFTKKERHPGYPILIKVVETRMKRLLKIAQLNEDLTPHSLRHTHTSLLAEANVNLEIIMERLGHTDDQTTKNIYLHVTQEMKKEASQKFGELMRSLKK
ncbi:site-specific integrase [Tenuibacillus multivorans]|uniref:Site-specific recombinase XerD n=1 Tax=Tenuibacillus multivorans TaxID=237069 RepID=A0A1H0E3S5_9BACI|nr:tyrosine-type recombinase/integrase [Tenuibacillus multivorans]GEL76663.1 site-specific integrase [Tenuibacillus multivorans]SDN77062.1 Site-specific recombinase XerD [Tenuibacillus multivorans]